MKRIAACSWGPDVERLLSLYTSEARTAVSYAAAVWYTPTSPKHDLSLTKDMQDRLDAYEARCLTAISGAFINTTRVVLRKELHLSKLSQHLQAVAIRARARTLLHESGSSKSQHWQQPSSTTPCSPYPWLFAEAAELLQRSAARAKLPADGNRYTAAKGTEKVPRQSERQ